MTVTIRNPEPSTSSQKSCTEAIKTEICRLVTEDKKRVRHKVIAKKVGCTRHHVCRVIKHKISADLRKSFLALPIGKYAPKPSFWRRRAEAGPKLINRLESLQPITSQKKFAAEIGICWDSIMTLVEELPPKMQTKFWKLYNPKRNRIKSDSAAEKIRREFLLCHKSGERQPTKAEYARRHQVTHRAVTKALYLLPEAAEYNKPKCGFQGRRLD